MNTMPGLTDRDRDALITLIRRVVDAALELPANPDPKKIGGYLTVLDEGNPSLIIPFGEMPEEKVQKYFQLSQEKAFRLFRQPEHLSSFQSQNPEANQWPGAVRANNDIILSFSGMPWKIDEAICLVIGVNMRWLPLKQALLIADISDNKLFEPLFRLVD
jgi:hypothetical protein